MPDIAHLCRAQYDDSDEIPWSCNRDPGHDGKHQCLDGSTVVVEWAS